MVLVDLSFKVHRGLIGATAFFMALPQQAQQVGIGLRPQAGDAADPDLIAAARHVQRCAQLMRFKTKAHRRDKLLDEFKLHHALAPGNLHRFGLWLSIYQNFRPTRLDGNGETGSGQFNMVQRKADGLKRFQVEILRVQLQSQNGPEIFPA